MGYSTAGTKSCSIDFHNFDFSYTLTSISGSELRMLLKVVVAFQFADLVLQSEEHFKPLFLLIIHARDGDFFQLLDHIAMAEKRGDMVGRSRCLTPSQQMCIVLTLTLSEHHLLLDEHPREVV